MTEKHAVQIKTLYTELSKLAPSQDWEKILKVSKKILGFSTTEKKAFQSKLVCLIHLEKFEEALSSIQTFTTDDPNEFTFEKAYCEYRLKRLESAYDTLKKCKQMGNRENELMAQMAYKLEKFEESNDIYRKLIKNVKDEFDAERQTNMAAVVASLRAADPSSTKDLDMTENENRTYELCYNSACLSISKKSYKEAYDKLVKAESMCKEAFEDEEDDEDGFEQEVKIIRNQLNFCLQKLSNKEEALKAYKLSGEEMPSLEELISKENLDIDTLESQFAMVISKYGKSKAQDTKSPDGKLIDKKSKKKKKRKTKLPKNYNPAIPLDPERWLPLRERSYYKGKRNKKNTVGKGTQGAVSGGGKDTPSTQSTTAQSPKPGSANSPQPQQGGTKPKLPQNKIKKKKPVSKW